MSCRREFISHLLVVATGWFYRNKKTPAMPPGEDMLSMLIEETRKAKSDGRKVNWTVDAGDLEWPDRRGYLYGVLDGSFVFTVKVGPFAKSVLDARVRSGSLLSDTAGPEEGTDSPLVKHRIAGDVTSWVFLDVKSLDSEAKT